MTADEAGLGDRPPRPLRGSLPSVTTCGYTLRVSRIQKLKRKLRQNPRGIHFNELVRVLESLGYKEARSSGSHHVFRPAGPGPSILVVKPHGGRSLCAMADVERVIALFEEEEIDGQG